MKIAALRILKLLGFFRLCEHLTRRRLRILCYHGFAADDEHEFRAALFMRPQVLAARLDTLVRRGYPVLPLSEALRRLRDGTLPDRATVITIDDGFKNVARLAAPVFRERRLPATLYVTTYYVRHRAPIFRLVVQYLCWKTAASADALKTLLTDEGVTPRGTQRDELMWQLIELGEAMPAEDGREGLAAKLAQRLGFDYAQLRDSQMMGLVDEDDIRSLPESGIDIELHTHRHRLPHDTDGIRREIADNRAVLEALTGRHLTHLCYPSGEWERGQWEALAALDVQSATTCDFGMNDADSPPLGLKRILDRDDITDIEFEAWISGAHQILRSLPGLRPRPDPT